MAYALPAAQRPRPALALALLVSLLLHALLLSLTFGGQGAGLPGLVLPWQPRRIEVPELRVQLVPTRVAAAVPRPEAGVEQPLAVESSLSAAAVIASTARLTTEAATVARADQPIDTLPLTIPEPAVIALARPDEAKWVVPLAPVVVAAAPSAPIPEAADAARAHALEQAQLNRARLEAQQQAQQQAEKLEAERQEAARQQALRAEAARLEATRLAADQEATRQAAARQEAARQDAVRLDTARAEEEKREARLRAIGRQLNEEADRREAVAAAAARLPPTVSNARRGRLFGRSDANAELVLYAEAWSRKIQLNMTFDSVREAAKQPHTDPLVTVAIRSDGSVESVSFVSSSGVAAIDEAIRRIVQSQANYPAFPPGLAREFDVIEIRRTWHFDMAIRLY